MPGLVAHWPPRPAGTGTRLSLTRLPHVWAPHPRGETLVISGSLAFHPASQGAALFIPNPLSPLRSPHGLTARLCPQDSRLSGTSKAPSSAGCWEGGREGWRMLRMLRRQLDPNPSSEG